MESYDDLRPFVVSVLALQYLMAEKIRALLVRGKPRDVYDIWLLHPPGGGNRSSFARRAARNI